MGIGTQASPPTSCIGFQVTWQLWDTVLYSVQYLLLGVDTCQSKCLTRCRWSAIPSSSRTKPWSLKSQESWVKRPFHCSPRSVPVAFATATPELGIHWILTLLFIFNFLETNCTFPTLVTTMNHNMILFSSQPTMTLNLTRGRSEIRIHSAETMPEYPWILQRWQPNVTHISSIPRAFSGARHWTLNISFGYCQPKLLWPSTPGRSCAVVVQPILSEAPTAGRGLTHAYGIGKSEPQLQVYTTAIPTPDPNCSLAVRPDP